MESEKPLYAEASDPVAEPIPQAVVSRTNAAVRLGTGVLFQSMSEVHSVASALVKSGAAPKGQGVGHVLLAILKGQALGFDVATSLGNVTVINGRTTLGGDMALAVIRRSGLLKDFVREWIGTEGGDDYGCRIRMARKDTGESVEYAFTFGDAKRAGLCRTSMWTAFTKRMVYYRALGFVVRDLWSDLILGSHLTEEVRDEDALSRSVQAPEASIPASAATDPFFAPATDSTGEPAKDIEAGEPPVLDLTLNLEAPAPEQAQVIDLMEVLKASLAEKASSEAPAPPPASEPAAEPEPNSPEDPFRGFREPEAAAAPPPAEAPPAPAPSRNRRPRRPGAPLSPTSTVTVTKNEQPASGGRKW